MALTYKPDLDILPLDLHAKNQVHTSVHSPAGGVTHTATHRLTHNVKIITLTADGGGKIDLFSERVHQDEPLVFRSLAV